MALFLLIFRLALALLLLDRLPLHWCPQDGRTTGFGRINLYRQHRVLVREPMPASCCLGVGCACRKIAAALSLISIVVSGGYDRRPLSWKNFCTPIDEAAANEGGLLLVGYDLWRGRGIDRLVHRLGKPSRF